MLACLFVSGSFMDVFIGCFPGRTKASHRVRTAVAAYVAEQQSSTRGRGGAILQPQTINLQTTLITEHGSLTPVSETSAGYQLYGGRF